jgi:hypothetical protein
MHERNAAHAMNDYRKYRNHGGNANEMGPTKRMHLLQRPKPFWICGEPCVHAEAQLECMDGQLARKHGGLLCDGCRSVKSVELVHATALLRSCQGADFVHATALKRCNSPHALHQLGGPCCTRNGQQAGQPHC